MVARDETLAKPSEEEAPPPSPTLLQLLTTRETAGTVGGLLDGWRRTEEGCGVGLARAEPADG